MTDERTTSAGLWRFAMDFFSAAGTVSKASGEKFSGPTYFLHGRSIELALKAFLLGRGVPYKDLRFKPFGHDLDALLKESRRRKLGTIVKLSNQERGVIELLNQQYSAKRFEYIVTGTMSVPGLMPLQFVNASLVSSLRAYCLKSTFGSSLTIQSRGT